MNKRLPRLCDNNTCTGCLACVNACNTDALTITKDEEGFYRPHIWVDKCVKCGLCENSCPVINPAKKFDEKELIVFAAWNKNSTVRAKSTSGGAFSALADVVLARGGVVFGAAYTEDLHVAHIEVSDSAGLEKLRQSKYAQSFIGDTMKQVKQRLLERKTVLFVGTPCQVNGLKNYLHRDYDNLILVDFICHGVASNDMLQTYLHWLEKKYGKITHMSFRDKRKGWYDSLRVIITGGKKERVLRGKEDNYWVAYNNKYNCLQLSCYQCAMRGFPRCSDLTIADFWRIGHKKPFGHKEEIEKGVSFIAVNNSKVLPLLKETSATLFMEERQISETIAGNPAAIKSSPRPESRDFIYKDMQTMEYDVFRKKYMATTIRQDAVKIFREYLPFPIIKIIRLLKQK
jgi:coenzyme F420-reducing hydrogenase beta subunit